MNICKLTLNYTLIIFSIILNIINKNSSAQSFCILSDKIDTTYLTYFEINGKYGMIDYKGNEIIQPIYRGIDDFSSGVVIALKNDTDLVVINNKGIEVARMNGVLKIDDINFPQDLKVDWDLSYKDSLFLYLNKFYNINGEIIKTINHDYICSNYNEGLALIADLKVDNNNQRRCYYGYIDKFDEIKFPVVCEAARPFKSGFAAIKLNKKWGFIDNKCNLKIKPKYDVVWDFNEGYAVVIIKDTVFIIDTLGNQILKLSSINTNEWYFTKVTSGMYPVKNESYWGFIDILSNKYLIYPVFDNVNTFNESGFASVETNKKWGVIDKNGFVVVDFISNEPIIFSPSGIARISYDSYYTYVDYTGNILKKIFYE